jgi:hypothetical protein
MEAFELGTPQRRPMLKTLQYYSSRPLVIFDGMSHDQPEIDTPSRPNDCIWCNAKLTSIDFRDGVCVRCYNLLTNAGLRDDAIFQSERQDKEPNRSRF